MGGGGAILYSIGGHAVVATWSEIHPLIASGMTLNPEVAMLRCQVRQMIPGILLCVSVWVAATILERLEMLAFHRAHWGLGTHFLISWIGTTYSIPPFSYSLKVKSFEQLGACRRHCRTPATAA